MIKVSTNVAARPEKVFSFLSDFGKAPLYSNIWKSADVLSHEGDTTVYHVVAEVMGRKMTSVTKIRTFLNERIEAETTDGDGKGTALAFRFQGIPEGTQITLVGDVVLPGFAKFLGGAARGRVESAMQEELTTIKNALEMSTGE